MDPSFFILMLYVDKMSYIVFFISVSHSAFISLSFTYS